MTRTFDDEMWHLASFSDAKTVDEICAECLRGVAEDLEGELEPYQLRLAIGRIRSIARKLSILEKEREATK